MYKYNKEVLGVVIGLESDVVVEMCGKFVEETHPAVHGCFVGAVDIIKDDICLCFELDDESSDQLANIPIIISDEPSRDIKDLFKTSMKQVNKAKMLGVSAFRFRVEDKDDEFYGDVHSKIKYYIFVNDYSCIEDILKYDWILNKLRKSLDFLDSMGDRSYLVIDNWPNDDCNTHIKIGSRVYLCTNL